MSEQKKESITIKKSSLWKYTTFILIVALIVVLIVFLVGGGNTKTTNTGGNTNTGTVGNAADVSVITDNSDLFPSMGPDNADTTVIEFIDFQCPYCGLASGLVPWADKYQAQYADLIGSSEKVKELAKEGKIKLSVVSMSFLGQESVYAAQAALCANEQGKFFEMYDALFSAQTEGENTGKYNKDKLEIIAQGVNGLDQAQFTDCLENDKTLNGVKQIASTASQFASGTPTFLVNGQKVSASWTALSSAIGA